MSSLKATTHALALSAATTLGLHTTPTEEHDIECPGRDDFRSDVGCQVRCRGDAVCSAGTRVMRELNATHISYNCCPPYDSDKCVATIKGGPDPLSGLQGDQCERQCAAKLSRHYYRMRMSHEVPLCAARGSGADGSSLHLFGNYLRARNVAMNFAKSGCGSTNKRSVKKGFLIADCNLGGRIPNHLTNLNHLVGPGLMQRPLPPICRGRRNASSTEQHQAKTTIFVSRDDMGNFAHHMGDMLGVFQLFDHLQLRPEQAQIALLDVRLMCSRPCQPDCLGPFAKLWGALSGGSVVRRAHEWAETRVGPVCFRDAIFHTHWSEVAKLAWAPPSRCVGSEILQAFRARVMAHQGVLGLAPRADPIRAVLSSRRAYRGMGKKSVRRAILNEPELLGAIGAAFADVDAAAADFGSLSLSEQMATTRVARVLFGMHGAGLTNLLWMPRECVVLEMHPYRAMISPVLRNLAKFAGCVALHWTNPLPSHHREAGANTVVSWPHFRPTFEAAVWTARSAGSKWDTQEALLVQEGGRQAALPNATVQRGVVAQPSSPRRQSPGPRPVARRRGRGAKGRGAASERGVIRWFRG